jgi:hypothetical protein
MAIFASACVDGGDDDDDMEKNWTAAVPTASARNDDGDDGDCNDDDVEKN